MPSRTVAIAVAAMVLLSGCSMLGGDTASETPDAPDYHGIVFAADTGGNAYEATVTVSKDGETLVEQPISSDGTGTFENLSTFEESGPYTVTVNTTLPAPGHENRSERTTVNGTLGNQTVIAVSYRGIDVHSMRLPRQEMNEPLYFQKRVSLPVPANVVVEHRGETVVSKTVERNGTGPFEIGDLPETGVYRVAVGGHDGEWENATILVTDPDQKLVTGLNPRPFIHLYPPGTRLGR